MSNRFLYVNSEIYKSYGVRVIVDRIVTQDSTIQICHDLSEIEDGATVYPYGILEAKAVLDAKRFKTGLALLIDAYSLGEYSNFKKMWNKRYIPFSYRLKGLLRSIKFLLLERQIFKAYDRIMLVSYGDKSYYERHQLFKKYANKICVVPNGVILPQYPNYHTIQKEGVLRIGCLSPWGGPSFYTLQYFLNEIWCKMPDHDGLELVVAGWGLSPEKKAYIENYPNTRVIGSVEKLEDFYSNIDVSLVTMLKKCGIINRVLDGLSFEVPVLTRPESLLAFKDLPDCYYTYETAESFAASVNSIRNNYEEAIAKTKVAKEYILQNHDWDINYQNINRIL